MGYCPECGSEVRDDANFCPECGASLGEETRKDTSTAENLVLVGAVVAFIWPAIWLAMAWSQSAMFDGFSSWFGSPDGSGPMVMFQGFAAFYWIFAIVLALVSVVLGVLALIGRKKVREGDVEDGGVLALISGVLLFVFGSFVAGILVAVGGFLVWSD